MRICGWQATDDVSTRFYATYSDYYAELPRELTAAQYAADPWQARPDAIVGNQSKHVGSFRLAFKTTVANIAGGTLEIGASHEEQSLYHPIVSLPFFSLLIDTDHKDSGGMLRYRRTAGDHDLVVRRQLRLLGDERRQLPERRRQARRADVHDR